MASDILERLRQRKNEDEGRYGFWDPVLTDAANEIASLRTELERTRADLDGAKCDLADAKANGLAERTRADRAEAREAELRNQIELLCSTLESSAWDTAIATRLRRALAGVKGGA